MAEGSTSIYDELSIVDYRPLYTELERTSDDEHSKVIIKHLFNKDFNPNVIMSHFSHDLLDFMKDLAVVSKRGDFVIFNDDDIPPLYVYIEEEAA